MLKIDFEQLNNLLESVNGKIDFEQFEKEYNAQKSGKKPETKIVKKVEKEAIFTKPQIVMPTDEEVEKSTTMEVSLDWENAFKNSEQVKGVYCENLADGLIMSLNQLGRVDIEYISQITALSLKDVIFGLKGAIFQNPESWGGVFYKGWETADEYLSGNLLRKREIAITANIQYRGYFKENIDAINKVMPEEVNQKDIYVTLGSPWLPSHVVDKFIIHLLGGAKYFNHPDYATLFDEITGTWEIPFKRRYMGVGDVKSTSTFGTSRLNALEIIERTLNQRPLTVYDQVMDYKKDKKVSVLNKEETMLCVEKQALILRDFQKWVWRDKARAEELRTIFTNKFGSLRTRRFNGGFLTLPTMNKLVKLYDYQKNAIARILFTPNTLLAHDVGSGKTYVMIAAGEELKRIGASKKNMFVVPNNIIGQWKEIYADMYPNSNVLYVEPKVFTPAKKKETLIKMRDGNYDAIVICYSCFSSIQFGLNYYKNQIIEEIDSILIALKNPKRAKDSLKTRLKRLEKKRVEIEEEELLRKKKVDDKEVNVYFNELGITRLFVDEAHNFKNLPLDTKIGHVLGINSQGSIKCKDMLEKVRFVQKTNGGGGVCFATGTPISNSITDVFTLQTYLQSGELSLLDLSSFDAWIGMFAEKQTVFEIDVDTSSYRLATRFSKFHNIPELTNMLAGFADFHDQAKAVGLPIFKGYNDQLIEKSLQLDSYLKEISTRADKVRNRKVGRNEDNMLKITTDGRKAALDIRLVDENAREDHLSKVRDCAENVFNIYQQTSAKNLTQIVFCDSSTPKAGFNIYDELTRLLLLKGVLREHVAYIHNAHTERQRTDLFNKMRRGEIRVLIGSTFKLGLGVNVQDKLVAVHHIDVPWKPADMVQRNGRIIRQGNQNSQVFIYRYITKGSFDAYSWQLLETKQRFICDLLSGTVSQREASNVDDIVLDYAEIKALAIGNPLIKERVEVSNQLSKCVSLQARQVILKQTMEERLNALPALIEKQREVCLKCLSDVQEVSSFEPITDKEWRRDFAGLIQNELMANHLQTEEKTIASYQGFSLIMPSNMDINHPYLVLQREGRYNVELSNAEKGHLIRIDNYIANLQEHYEKINQYLIALENEKANLEKEIPKLKFYGDDIEKLKRKLKRIDKKLGVDNDCD